MAFRQRSASACGGVTRVGRRARAKDKDKHHLVAALLRQRENCGGGDWAGGVADVSDDGNAVPVPTAASAAAAGGSER